VVNEFFFHGVQLGLWKIGKKPLSGFRLRASPDPFCLDGISKSRKPRRPTPEPRYNVAVPVVIREYQPEDFESLWRMDQECFPPGISYSRQELRSFMRHRGSFTLLALNEKQELQGFIIAHCGTGGGHVITIDVGPGTRRSGVGSVLLRSAEERMREAGCRAVGLETAVDNTGALAFYKRQGYHVVRTWPRYYANGVDALVLKKDLNGAA